MTPTRIALILAAFGLANPVAAAPEVATSPEPQAAEPAPELKALADSCSAHKFETVVVREGTMRGSKVKICGEPGQTDADWLNTLKSSIKQAENNPDLSPSVKAQIVTALRAEIARIDDAAKILPPASSTMIATLSPEVAGPAEPPPQYSIVPPLPAPKPRAALAKAGATAASAPVVRPRLTIRCALPRESFGDCARLERETQLLVQADENLAPGTSLRFLRGGDARADLDVGGLKQGESLRDKLPGRVCSGVLRGKVQVQILTKGQVAETRGPYALYCGS